MNFKAKRWVIVAGIVACAAAIYVVQFHRKSDELLRQKVRDAIQRIDKDADPLHGDYSPAAIELIEIGEPAMRDSLELYRSESAFTRLRAENVVRNITRKIFGYNSQKGWANREAEARWEGFWKAYGIRFDDPYYERLLKLERLKIWDFHQIGLSSEGIFNEPYPNSQDECAKSVV